MAATLTLANLVVRITSDATKYDKGIQSARQKTAGFGKDFARHLGLASTLGFAAAGAAVTKFAVDSGRAFMRFEEATNEVFTLMPDMSEAAMKEMREDIKEFGRDVGRTTDDVIPALYQAISAGVPRENVFDFLDTAHEAALGGVTDLETAVDGITSVVNAYGVEVVDATQASDLMFTAVKLGKTTFQELSQTMSGVTPLAAALGVNFGDVTASLAAMTSQGTPTAQAVVQLRGLLQELGTEGTVVAGVFQEAAGVGFAEFIRQGGTLADALKIVAAEAERTGTPIQDMFGNIRAGLGALQLTGAGMEKFVDNSEAMADSAGATAEAAERMGESGQRAVEEMGAAFESLKLTIGESVAPAMSDFARNMTNQLNLMSSTSEWNALREQLIDAGASWGDINEIVDDGRAKLDLWRTAADFERDLSRNEAGISRMELAISALNAGLEIGSDEFFSYVRAQDAATNRAEAMNEFYKDLAVSTEEVAEETGELADAEEEVAEATEEASVRLKWLRGEIDPTEAQLEALASAFGGVEEEAGAFGQGLLDMLSGDKLPFFKESISELGPQMVLLNGRTADQNRLLEKAQDEYERLGREINDIMAAPELFGLNVEEAAERVEELTARQGELIPVLERMGDITGTTAMVVREATVDYAALDEALLQNIVTAADAAAAQGTLSDEFGSAQELAILAAGALGGYNEQQIEAALKALALQEVLAGLAEGIATGTIDIDAAKQALYAFAEGEVKSKDDAIAMAEEVTNAHEALENIDGNWQANLSLQISNLDKLREAVGLWNQLGGGQFDLGDVGSLGAPLPGPGGEHGLDMIVPPGFTNDTFPVFASSGERVTITPENDLRQGEGGAGDTYILNVENRPARSMGSIERDFDMLRAMSGAL